MAGNMDIFVDMVRPDSECELANGGPFAVFHHVFNTTSGDPCNGCGYRTGCKFLSKQAGVAHSRRVRNFGKHDHETNAETAKRFGISKRQVAKLKRKGELE